MPRKKAVAKRNYRFSDGFLEQKCDDVSGSVTRDQTQHTERGFTVSDNEDFATQTKDFGELPTDKELEGAVMEATELKNTAAENVRVSVRMFRTAAKNKWGVDKARYRIYGFDDMNNMTDDELMRLGRRVTRRATEQLADLGSGITAAVITAHTARVLALDESIDAKCDAEKNRDIATEDRIEAGNDLYAVLVKVCYTGKNIWVTLDEARYNDYVIYDILSGGPEAPPLTP